MNRTLDGQGGAATRQRVKVVATSAAGTVKCGGKDECQTLEFMACSSSRCRRHHFILISFIYAPKKEFLLVVFTLVTLGNTKTLKGNKVTDV